MQRQWEAAGLNLYFKTVNRFPLHSRVERNLPSVYGVGNHHFSRQIELGKKVYPMEGPESWAITQVSE